MDTDMVVGAVAMSIKKENNKTFLKEQKHISIHAGVFF